MLLLGWPSLDRKIPRHVLRQTRKDVVLSASKAKVFMMNVVK